MEEMLAKPEVQELLKRQGEHQTIHDEFVNYVTHLYGDKLGRVQEQEIRRAFFGGAFFLFFHLQKMACASQEKAMESMEKYHRELIEFMADVADKMA